MSDSADKSTAWVVTPDQYFRDHPSGPIGSHTLQSCYVTVRDGTRLAVDVYLPGSEGDDRAWPTIVINTPYYRRLKLKEPVSYHVETSPLDGKYRDLFVPRGYALVVVDIRGTGASFGFREGLRSPVERHDYYDVAEWVVEQPWCNGTIGTIGVSYVGAAACFLGSSGHPAVKAVIPSFAAWDTYADQCYPGGLLMNHWPRAYNALMEALDHDAHEKLREFPYWADPHFDGPAPVDEDQDCRLRDEAIAEHLFNIDADDFVREFAYRDSSLSYAPDYTIETISPYNYASNIRPETAYYCVSGWMDSAYGNAGVRRFLSLQNKSKHLLLGPWEHGARTNASPFREAIEPQFNLAGEYLRFFDHYLKGLDTGLEKESPIHYFTMAEEAWKEADNWPSPAATDVILYFGENGTLSQSAPVDDMAFDEYRADYCCGTGTNTRYERLSAHAVEEYYADWHGRDARMLTYTTNALEEHLEVTGHPIVTLHVSSTERDGAFFAYLEDIENDGTCRYVTEGVFRAIHRKVSIPPWNQQGVGPFHSFRKEDAELMVPGEQAEISFALFPTSWLFRKGHRIRLALASADRDHFSRIPGGRRPTLRYFRSRTHASRIVLPVVKG